MSILPHSRAMADETPSYAASTCSTTSGEGMSTDTLRTEKSPSGAKRRASRAGTRSVSTLTPAQLQRKRANDREAQRAIRQRNKEHIENLERRIEELSVGNVDAVTLVNLRKRIRDLEEELSKANDNLAVSRSQQISSHPLWQARSNGDLVHAQTSYNDSSAMMIPARSGFSVPEYDNHSTSFSSHHSLIVPESEDNKNFILSNEPDLQRTWVHPNLGLEHSGSMGFTSTAPYPHQVQGIFPSGFNGHMTTSPFMSQPSMHAFELPIRYAPPTCVVDNILISVLQTQRRGILEGTSQVPALHPHLGALVKSATSSTFPATEPISQALTRILCDYSLRIGLAETAACFYVMHKLLQWQISPTTELYEQIPEWYRPRPIQLSEPHSIWASFVAWPKLREKIISNQSLYATQEFSNTLSASLCLNWPQGGAEILMYVEEEVRITPAFEKHICNIENWSLGTPFQQRYPELRDSCRFSNINYGLKTPVLRTNRPQA